MDMDVLFDKLGGVLLYAVIAMLGAILLIGALVYFFKRERFADFKKYVVGVIVGFAIVAAIVMGYVKSFDTNYDGNGKALTFWPVMAEIIVALAGGVAMLVCSLFGKKPFKVASICTLAGVLGGFIAIMVQMSKYYEEVKGDYDANLTGLIVSAIAFICLIIAAYILGNKREESDTRAIVYGALAIALSYALSYVKFFKMPQGGSVTFASLLPLMIYCCMFGTRRGLIVCLLYGAMQALQDTYIIHPMQFLLDYPLAFGLIGVSGIFVEKGFLKQYPVVGFLLGGMLAVCLRYACHVCSGVFAFASWADLDAYGTVTAYSMAYNSFAFIDMLIALAAGVILFGSRAFIDQMRRSSAPATTGEGDEVVNDGDDDFEAQIFDRSAEEQGDDLQLDDEQQTDESQEVEKQEEEQGE